VQFVCNVSEAYVIAYALSFHRHNLWIKEWLDSGLTDYLTQNFGHVCRNRSFFCDVFFLR
jgi:hypothetical protein